MENNIVLNQKNLPKRHPARYGVWELIVVVDKYVLHSPNDKRVLVYRDPELKDKLCMVEGDLHDTAKFYQDGNCIKVSFLFKNDKGLYKLLYIDEQKISEYFNPGVDIDPTLESYLEIPEDEQTVHVKNSSNNSKFKVKDFDDPSVLYIEDHIRYVNLEDLNPVLYLQAINDPSPIK